MKATNDWTILNIAPTDDRNAVRRAYMEQLSKHNPEDDSEGFLRVRSAYENILKELERRENEQDEQQEDAGPVAAFLKRVEKVYDDFEKRRDIEVWKELLNDEACVRLDTEDDVSEQLLVFFFNRHHIPHKVWVLLNERFQWTQNEADLKRVFPVNFIDFVIHNVSRESLPYELFTQYEDFLGEIETQMYDRWIHLFFEIDNALIMQETETENFESMLNEIENIPLRHIYYDLITARLKIKNGQAEEALADTMRVIAQIPNDMRARYTHASILLLNGKTEEASAIYKEILESNPNDFNARRGLIETLAAKKEYETARTMLLDIMDEMPYNPFALHMFRMVTEELTHEYEEKYAQNPEDTQTVMILAKHYLNGYQYEKCRIILEKMPCPDNSDPENARYYEYLADCYANEENFLKAVELYSVNTQMIRKYRNYVKYTTTLLDMKKYDEALLIINEGLIKVEDDEDILSKAYLYDNKGLALHNIEDYEDALRAYDDALSYNSEAAHIYVHKARTLQAMHRYGGAVDCCEKAIEIFPYHVEAYTIQMEIFYEADLYDRMIELAVQAEEIGLESPRVKYHKACALRMKGDLKKTREILNELLEAEYDEDYRDFFYVESAYTAIAEEDYQTALRHIEKAVELNSEPLYRHVLVGNIRRMCGDFQEALCVYDELIAKHPNYIHALMGRGNVHYDMEEYAKALRDYRRALNINENNENAFDRIISTLLAQKKHSEAVYWAEREIMLFDSADNHLQLAWIYERADQNEKAEFTYKRAVEKFSEQARPHRSYGVYLKNRGRYEEALAQFKEAVERDKEQPHLYSEIAYCMAQLKRFDEALEVLDKGQEIHSKYPGDIIMRRGLVYNKMRRYSEALPELLRALDYEAEIGLHWNMAYIYTLIGIQYEMYRNDAENALHYYKMALERNGEYTDALKYIGDIYLYYYRDYEEAVQYYSRAAESEPARANVYAARALAYTRMKKTLKANADYKKALALYKDDYENDKEDICYNVYMAICHIGLKKHSHARELINRVINCGKPSCGKAVCDEGNFLLGCICESEGKYNEALEFYKKALAETNSVKHNEAVKDLLAKMGQT